MNKSRDTHSVVVVVVSYLGNDINVVLELGRDGDDGSISSHSAVNETLDLVSLIECLGLLDQVNLVLQNEDVLQFHDHHGSQMLAGLWLRTWFVSGNEQQRSVHHCSSVQHGRHENIVTRAILLEN